MGACMSHRVDYPNEIHPNIFTVTMICPKSSILDPSRINNNNNGTRPKSKNGHRPNTSNNEPYGQLEVCMTSLVFHRRGHEPVAWPLTFVKRYGYENSLFSFEGGRRCVSPGIFTFRCRKAEQLFTCVQGRVQEHRHISHLSRSPGKKNI